MICIIWFTFFFLRVLSVEITVGLDTISSFPHFWENSVGSGHATLTLREDWRYQLKRAQQDLGFKLVRFHGLLDDDMGTYQGDGLYSFYNIDQSFDYLISIGMKPLVELSFMPNALASANTTIFNYNANTSPPKDYEKWKNLIIALGQHLVDRYGNTEVSSWYFEVWNEPDIAFWNGTQQQYFQLYEYTSRALKSVFPGIRVGGPVVAYSVDYVNDFVNFITKNNVPTDFISCHQYGGDHTDYGSIPDMMSTFSAIKEIANTVNLPLVISEYGISWELYTPVLDESGTAAFVVAIINQVYSLSPSVFSYWTFSDIFEEQGFPTTNSSFYGGFGMMTLYNIPKPVYRAFQLLHEAGDFRAKSVISGISNGCLDTVGALSLVDNISNSLSIFIFNHAPGNVPISSCDINVTINSLNNPEKSGHSTIFYKMDNDNTNPKQTWIELGMPQYPSSEQINLMLLSSQLKQENITSFETTQSSLKFNLIVSPRALIVVKLKI